MERELGVGLIASDDFNRANNADLGTLWTPQTANVWSIVNTSVAQASASGNSGGEYRNDIAPSSAQFAKIELTATIDTATNNGAGPAICMALAADTAYSLYINTIDTIQLIHRVGGAETILVTNNRYTPIAGGVIVLTKDRYYRLTVFVNGIELFAFDDIANAQRLEGGMVGVHGRIFNVVSTLDNWEGGDLIGLNQPPNVRLVSGYSVQ